MKCPICNWPMRSNYCDICGHETPNPIKTQKPEKKESTNILYICNQQKCENCTWPVCQHTTDIKYAANFYTADGAYWEKF